MDAMQARAQTWRRRLEDQQASGLCIAVWCRNNGCCRQSFYRWQARLGHGQDPGSVPAWTASRASDASAAFKEIRLAPPNDLLGHEPLAPQPLRLVLIGGRELLVPMSMPAASLAQLLGVIESLPPVKAALPPAGLVWSGGACPELARPERSRRACPEFVQGVEGSCPELACPERSRRVCPELVQGVEGSCPELACPERSRRVCPEFVEGVEGSCPELVEGGRP
jgi:hypothetical protein